METKAIEAVGETVFPAEGPTDAPGDAGDPFKDSSVRSLQLQSACQSMKLLMEVVRLHLELGTIVKITIEAPEGGYFTGTMPGRAGRDDAHRRSHRSLSTEQRRK